MAKHRHPRRRGDDRTLDLFEHQHLFAVEAPRELGSALDFNGKLSQAMSRALDEARDHGLDRYDVARRMSEILDQDVSKRMIDAYTSQARETHTISAVRFKAFVRATGCVWLWNVYLDGEGLTILMGEEALHAQASRIVALKCDDNVWVQTTAQEALVVLTAGVEGHAGLFGRQAANLARYGALKKLIADASDQADLDAVDLDAGWLE